MATQTKSKKKSTQKNDEYHDYAIVDPEKIESALTS